MAHLQRVLSHPPPSSSLPTPPGCKPALTAQVLCQGSAWSTASRMRRCWRTRTPWRSLRHNCATCRAACCARPPRCGTAAPCTASTACLQNISHPPGRHGSPVVRPGSQISRPGIPQQAVTALSSSSERALRLGLHDLSDDGWEDPAVGAGIAEDESFVSTMEKRLKQRERESAMPEKASPPGTAGARCSGPSIVAHEGPV